MKKKKQKKNRPYSWSIFYTAEDAQHEYVSLLVASNTVVLV